jgi:hypothetical protein
MCVTLTDPQEFNRYDTNHDGLVDAPEYGQGEQRERQRKLDSRDQLMDGVK